MENTLGTGQAARLLGVTVKTLQRWEREGRLVPAARTAGNRRRLNQEHLSPEREMVQDLMTIAHCFSGRLSGLRNCRRQLRAALESDHAAGAPDQN